MFTKLKLLVTKRCKFKTSQFTQLDVVLFVEVETSARTPLGWEDKDSSRNPCERVFILRHIKLFPDRN